MCSLTTNNKQIETITNIIPLTHNQRVPGSSPGGPTLNDSHLQGKTCRWLFLFAVNLHTIYVLQYWHVNTK